MAKNLIEALEISSKERLEFKIKFKKSRLSPFSLHQGKPRSAGVNQEPVVHFRGLNAHFPRTVLHNVSPASCLLVLFPTPGVAQGAYGSTINVTR